nr:serine/threonine-protein phosphatase [Oscillospiraceae bacterium]
LLKDTHSFVIGGMEGVKYKEYEMVLDPGDKLFLYTDGIPEAADVDNNMFGTDRMLDTLNADPGRSPEELIKAVSSAVADFASEAEQYDDQTLLCLVYNGKQQG